VQQIAEFVQTTDAAFPTGVILHVESGDAEYRTDSRMLLVRDSTSIARILDGQHRLAGLRRFEGAFDLNVVIFVGADIAEQAFIFATINLAQTKVNKSLVFDLLEYEKHDSPQKTAHNICRAMNRTEGSPFHERIKVLGLATREKREVLTQATFVEELLRHISRRPLQDREILKEQPRAKLPQDRKQIFRRLFIEDKDSAIGACVWAFFRAVSERWPTAWNNLDPGNLMVRTTGFKALMRFLVPAYLSINKEIPAISEFRVILDRVTLSDSDCTADTQQYGSSGPSALYKALLSQSGIKEDGSSQNALFT
jgi:DGQHR domain-containing protein